MRDLHIRDLMNVARPLSAKPPPWNGCQRGGLAALASLYAMKYLKLDAYGTVCVCVFIAHTHTATCISAYTVVQDTLLIIA